MSADYPPGTVAMLRTPLGQEFMAVRTKGGSGDYWSAPTNWPLGVPADECDVRRLVVLDPENREEVARLLSSLRRMGFAPYACGAFSCLEAALREFPAPPKPTEPTGLGAVVEDAAGVRWTLTMRPPSGGEPKASPWCRDHILANGVKFAEWSEIDAVRVLSEGVTDA